MLVLESSSNVLEIPNAPLQLTQSKSAWLFNTQTRVLQSNWSIKENSKKATVNISMP